ncbi:MAG: response regulator [Candidatus Omnitrophica bacterium]|jgi:CheY-like chemotaxis protein|nr:response regulator [Candidatus Omnitrophota bacterium]
MAKKKVLIVDDEVDFLEMLKLRLEANNYAVVTARDGNDALEKFKKEKPAAVLLDILMPGMDGLDILKKIRKDDTKIPVFIITAFSNEERFRVANKFNASGFIVKTNDLQKEIQNITAAIGISEDFKGK